MNSNKGTKLVLAYSGGLDTSYCLKLLSKQGFDVFAVFVDTKSIKNTDEVSSMHQKAMQLGAKEFECIDALNTFYDKIIRFLIYGNVLRNNTYPLSVSAERVIQAMLIKDYAKKLNAKYIAHGCTGAGNDQVRFEMAFQILAPDINIIAPIREKALTREQEVAYLRKHGIDLQWEKAQYSVNDGLWGTSVGGSETLVSGKSLPEKAYPYQIKKYEAQPIEISFEKGQISSIDNQIDDEVSLIQRLNHICQQYAIGRDIHVGDTIIGIKGRIGFQAGGALLLIKAHHLLEKHTQSKWQQFQKEQLSNFYGMMLHEGHYWDPVMRDIESYLENSQRTVTGTVFCRLHPYRYEILGVKSTFDLLENEYGSYGEQNKGWSDKDSQGFIKLQAMANKIFHQVNKSK